MNGKQTDCKGMVNFCAQWPPVKADCARSCACAAGEKACCSDGPAAPQQQQQQQQQSSSGSGGQCKDCGSKAECDLELDGKLVRCPDMAHFCNIGGKSFGGKTYVQFKCPATCGCCDGTCTPSAQELAKYEVKPLPNKYKSGKFQLEDTFGQYSCEFWESKDNLGPSYQKYIRTVANEKHKPVCLSNGDGSAETTCALRFPPNDPRCGTFTVKQSTQYGALIKLETSWGGQDFCLNIANLKKSFRPSNEHVQPNGKLYPLYFHCYILEQQGWDRVRWTWVEEKNGPWKGFCFKGHAGEFDWCFKPKLI
jgi:hypothetical protein